MSAVSPRSRGVSLGRLFFTLIKEVVGVLPSFYKSDMGGEEKAGSNEAA